MSFFPHFNNPPSLITVVHMCLGVWLSIGPPTMAIPLKKSDSTFLNSHQLPITPLARSRAWTWTGLPCCMLEFLTSLILIKSWAHQHRCCWVICATAMSSPEASISQLSSLSSALPPPSCYSLSPGGGAGWTNIKTMRHSCSDGHARGHSERPSGLFPDLVYSQYTESYSGTPTRFLRG